MLVQYHVRNNKVLNVYKTHWQKSLTSTAILQVMKLEVRGNQRIINGLTD